MKLLNVSGKIPAPSVSSTFFLFFTGQRQHRRVRNALLQPRLHDEAGEAGGAVQVQVPLVLLRRVRGVRHRGRRQHVSVELPDCYD